MSTSTTTAVNDQVLDLLGKNVPAAMVASALGISASRVSQLISDPEFASQVSELRYKSLLRYSEADSEYDDMETALRHRMRDLIPLMYKPFEVLKAMQVINQAKRRGTSVIESGNERAAVVSLTLPTNIFNQHVVQNIQVNVNNLVTRAGDQDLVTIQSSQMDKMLDSQRQLALQNAVKELTTRKEEPPRKDLNDVLYQSNSPETA